MKLRLPIVLVAVLGLLLGACSGSEEITPAAETKPVVNGGAETSAEVTAEGIGEPAAEADAPSVPVEPTVAKDVLQFEVVGFENGGTIPDSMAFCIPSATGHVSFGSNTNPELKWSQVPEGTKSFAIVCHDSEAPTAADDVNKEGRTIPKDLKRADFYHWIMADMTPGLRGLSAGQDSKEVTSGGKAPGPTDYGARGINDYTSWFSADEKMRGEYGGYDGPCPPWNDERMHVYHFTLYALSVDSLKMEGSFNGSQLMAAMEGKILEQATWSGTYSLNKALRGGAPPKAAPAPEAAATPEAK